ncbi:MAG: transaldolase [Zoogloeaceae bacterium]|jgi:transaldolase|nr:transaldolase [Zoogloeaceae bacterium]MBP9653502.1 transaldolase [Rhodocyclaceae bacterium]MCC7270122.1 transaldolase [Rhodocyclaceae bacterium]MCZ2174068.1 transaldolase [Burkholderiales bacterium]
MSSSPTRELQSLGQRIWLDNLTRDLLADGTLARWIGGLSVSGVTSNPTILDHAIRHSARYDAPIRRLAGQGLPDEAIFFELVLEDLRQAAALFRPLHEASGGADGWVSLEVSPLLAADTAGTVAQAKALHARAGLPNLFIKIPATPEGIPAIEESLFAGVPVNVTLLFSAEQYLAAAAAWRRALERRQAAGLAAPVHSVASLFVSRWDKAVADRVGAPLRNRLGIAVAGRAYRAYREWLARPEVRRFAEAGMPMQRLLWASTGTKDPRASDVLYVEALAAPDTINTLPDATLLAFADHGRIGRALAADGGEAETVLAQFAAAGIDTGELADALLREGVRAFEASWRDLMACIASKRGA